MIRFLFLIFLLIVIVFGLSFAVENAHNVQFNYYVGSLELPLSLLLVFAVLAGGAVGVFASMFVFMHLKREIRQLRKSEATAREEIRNLRSLPIKDVL